MLKDFLELLKGVSLSPVQLSLELAAVTTLVLLLIGLPLSWWLARGQSRWCPAVNAVVTLPLVLPPSVLGFYILVALGPNGPLGMLTESLGLGTFNFSFPGLVIGSVIYSMPFMVQPLLPPSQIMPVRLLAMLLMVFAIMSTVPSFRYTRPQAMPLPAAMPQPQKADSLPEYSLMYMQTR